MSLNILVGADPEVFMRKDGLFKSAHGVIVGDKRNPQKVDRGAVQVDGLALEFNIDPAANEQEFLTNIKTVMGVLQSMVPDFELVPVPVAEFGAEYLASQPHEALELGCDPDFNAWEDGAPNPRPNGEVTFRTGAGHVHIGWGQDIDIHSAEHREACVMLTKQLDYYLGLPSMLYDTDTKRRTLYGAAGAFRPKPYGMEYRVLSNAWLKSEELMAWVYRNTVRAVNDLLDGNRAFEEFGDDAEALFRQERPDQSWLAQVLDVLDIELPPGFKYKRDGWNDIIGFES